SICAAADKVLGDTSWDASWQGMRDIMGRSVRAAVAQAPASSPALRSVSEASGATADGRRQNARPALSVIAGQSPAIRPRLAAKAHYDYLVVGAGFAGSVLAERLAAGLGKRVLVIDRRPHIGGNAYDYHNEDGILVHRYGPHVFHTNSKEVAAYLSRFTRWRPYEHRVRAHVDGMLLPIPINLTTINRLYGLDLDSGQAEAFLASRAEPVETVRSSEDVVVSRVGRELYEKFFRGYTRKQWGIDPSELDKAVTSRVPTRTNDDDRYFLDSFQNMPLHGFTRMFENIL